MIKLKEILRIIQPTIDVLFWILFVVFILMQSQINILVLYKLAEYTESGMKAANIMSVFALALVVVSGLKVLLIALKTFETDGT